MGKQITLDFFRSNISDDCMCLVVDQNGFYYYGCLPMLQFYRILNQLLLIEVFEADDKLNHEYTPNFYEVAEIEDKLIIPCPVDI